MLVKKENSKQNFVLFTQYFLFKVITMQDNFKKAKACPLSFPSLTQ